MNELLDKLVKALEDHKAAALESVEGEKVVAKNGLEDAESDVIELENIAKGLAMGFDIAIETVKDELTDSDSESDIEELTQMYKTFIK